MNLWTRLHDNIPATGLLGGCGIVDWSRRLVLVSCRSGYSSLWSSIGVVWHGLDEDTMGRRGMKLRREKLPLNALLFKRSCSGRRTLVLTPAKKISSKRIKRKNAKIPTSRESLRRKVCLKDGKEKSSSCGYREWHRGKVSGQRRGWRLPNEPSEIPMESGRSTWRCSHPFQLQRWNALSGHNLW